MKNLFAIVSNDEEIMGTIVIQANVTPFHVQLIAFIKLPVSTESLSRKQLFRFEICTTDSQISNCRKQNSKTKKTNNKSKTMENVRIFKMERNGIE